MNVGECVRFDELPLGAIFESKGKRFTKEALSMANAHENNWGHIFADGVPVTLVSLPAKPVEPWRKL